MKSERTLKKLLFSIATLEDLSEVLSSRQEFRENIRMALASVMGSLPVSKGALFLYHKKRHSLEFQTSRGLSLPEDAQIRISDNMASQLRTRKKGILADSPSRRMESFVRRAAPVIEMTKAEILQPLNCSDGLVGIITLGRKFSGEDFKAEDFDLLSVMASYIAIGIHNQELFTGLESRNLALKRKASQNRRLYRNLESLYHNTIKALGAAIDAKDPYTRGHSERVACFSEAIARRLSLSKREIAAVRIASHLHDIGKIAIDNSILLKPGKLNANEMDQIYRHPTVSFDILSNIKFPYPDVALIARHHHEWVNGGGYPDRISVDRLNVGVKILSLADAFDAMTSDRPYRPALDLELALREVRDNVMKQFDGEVSRAFFQILHDEVSGGTGTPSIINKVHSRYSPGRIKRFLEAAKNDLGRPQKAASA